MAVDKRELDSEEVTNPIAANVFIYYNGVEMALSVILVMADTINDQRQSLFLERGECFWEIHRYWWQQLAETERRKTRLSAVDLGKPSCKRSGRGRSIPRYTTCYFGRIERAWVHLDSHC